MAKIIALLALIALSLLATLGNYWFTYGIWPRSWWYFAFFALTSTALSGAVSAVLKDEN